MQIVILGAPRTAKNGNTPFFNRKTGKLMAFKKPGLAKWERDAAKQITGAHRKNFTVPCNVAVRVWMDADRRADLVGFIQAANDMLVRNGVIKDDSGNNPRIVVMHNGSKIEGVDRKNPRMEITITPLDL